MSLFKKNVPLKEEEVAPVMQEYSGQHPMLNFKSVSAIVKPDHLDQYMEVRPFESSEPQIGAKDFNIKFGTKRSPGQLRALRSKIQLKDGQSDEQNLDAFVEEFVNQTPGIICHKTTSLEMTLRSDKSKVDDTPLTYYFFPAIEDITGLTAGELKEGDFIEPEILKKYFYGGSRNIKKEMDTWILDKIVHM